MKGNGFMTIELMSVSFWYFSDTDTDTKQEAYKKKPTEQKEAYAANRNGKRKHTDSLTDWKK